MLLGGQFKLLSLLLVGVLEFLSLLEEASFLFLQLLLRGFAFLLEGFGLSLEGVEGLSNFLVEVLELIYFLSGKAGCGLGFDELAFSAVPLLLPLLLSFADFLFNLVCKGHLQFFNAELVHFFLVSNFAQQTVGERLLASAD